MGRGGRRQVVGDVELDLGVAVWIAAVTGVGIAVVAELPCVEATVAALAVVVRVAGVVTIVVDGRVVLFVVAIVDVGARLHLARARRLDGLGVEAVLLAAPTKQRCHHNPDPCSPVHDFGVAPRLTCLQESYFDLRHRA